jgi:uncharacterized protein
MRKFFIVLIIGTCTVGMVLAYTKYTKNYPVLQTNSTEKSKTLKFDTIELANTTSEREKGLMNRNLLCEKCGMLFVFEESSQLNFWMKNTIISLDIIFIDTNGKVVQIHPNTTPLKLAPTYDSSQPAKYVLETNAGFSKKNNIIIGDVLDIKGLISSGIEFKD